jgi:hypothetical protein
VYFSPTTYHRDAWPVKLACNAQINGVRIPGDAD